MLLADRFAYVHEPKTGGTFVTHVLTRVHGGLVDVRPTRRRGPFLMRLGLPTAAFRAELRRTPRPEGDGAKYGALYNWNDHGTCSEIPRPYRSRTILGTVRSPFETFVSLYLFGRWRRPEEVDRYRRAVPDFGRRYARFPELSFPEYMDLLHVDCVLPANRDFVAESGVGYLTERFVRFYFRLPRTVRASTYDAAAVLRRIDDAYIDSAAYREDMYDVRFIRTARLNEELREFLLDRGYETGDVEFVRRHEHVIPVGGTRVALAERATSHDWRRYYTSELLERVRAKDRLIFTLFPELDASEAAA